MMLDDEKARPAQKGDDEALLEVVLDKARDEIRERLGGELEALEAMMGPRAPEHVDIDGNPISFGRWAVLSSKPDYRQLALDLVHGYGVSTIWLGLNHGYGEVGLYFETLVAWHGPKRRGKRRQFREAHQERYETKAEALAGHARIVEALKRGDDPAGDDELPGKSWLDGLGDWQGGGNAEG